MNFRRAIFLTTFFFLLFGFLFLFKSASPVYAYWVWVCDTCSKCVRWGGCIEYDELGNCVLRDCREWRTYDCNCHWEWRPPEDGNGNCDDPCDGSCNPDSDGDGIANACDPCPNDPNNNCAGGCTNDSDCPPGATCQGGTCVGGDEPIECQETGSGDTCDPNAPNNGCPSGERCCWGVGFCYTACCGGGGGTPDTTNPQCGVEIKPKTVGDNLVKNPGFEVGNLKHWTFDGYVEKQTKIVHSGTYAARGSEIAVSGYVLEQDIPVEEGAIYALSLWAQAQFFSYEGDKNWGEAQLIVDPKPKPSSSLDETHIVSGRDRTSWKHFKATVYARDKTLTLRLKATSGGENEWYTNVAFDDISLKKIEGAETVPSRDVDIKIGVWDNRHISGRKIQKKDGSWPLKWTDFSYEESANKISVKLPKFEGLGVLVRDGAGNMGLCADGTSPKVGNPPDCTSLSIPSLINQGETVTLTAQASDTDGSVDRVKFYYTPYPQSDYCAASWTHIKTDRDGSDGWSKSWNTTGIAEGEYLVRADVYDDQNYWCTGNLNKCDADSACSDCRQVVTIQIVRDAWFQTEGGDVHAQTRISDSIPDTADEPYCSLLGNGGSPGVVSYGTNYNFKEGSGKGRGRVSEDPFGWLARSLYQAPTTYDYEYFNGLIDSFTDLPCGPSCSVTAMESLTTSDSPYKINQDLTIEETDDRVVNFGRKKIVILVNGNLNLNAQVRLADNSGFVAFIVRGNINVGGYSLTDNSNNPDLEGVYIANGTINTGSTGSSDEQQFRGKGMFIGWSDVNFQRDFEDTRNNDTPAEEFVYLPALWMNASKELLKSSYTWQELAP